MNSNKSGVITKKQESTWLFLMKMGRRLGCHQLHTRSFFYKNFQFPLCARCTGIMIGQFLLAPLSLLLDVNSPLSNVGFILIMGLDGGLQYFNIKESNNTRRFITGLLAGYAIMLLTITILASLIKSWG
jgi:uncharacterized membrane protein